MEILMAMFGLGIISRVIGWDKKDKFFSILGIVLLGASCLWVLYLAANVEFR
jgi:hypothetical protein